MFAELLAAAVLEPGAARLLHDQFFAPRRRQLVALWQRGVEPDPGDEGNGDTEQAS